MKPKRLLWAACCLTFLLCYTHASSQILFKLQWLPDSLAWGVFAKPEQGVNFPKFTVVGSGQVTIVVPPETRFHDLRSYSAVWEQNAYVPSPSENPGADYISFGLVTAMPPIVIRENEETLLFTFKPYKDNYPAFMYLMPNEDPFNQLPNSATSNPGNDLAMLDTNTGVIYNFTGIYAPEAWDWRLGNQVQQGPYRQGLSKRYPQFFIKP